MNWDPEDLTSLASYGLAAMAYLALAVYLAWRQRLPAETLHGGRILWGAVAASALWATASAAAAEWPLSTALAVAITTLDIARYAAWLAFLWLQTGAAGQRSAMLARWAMAGVAASALGAGLAASGPDTRSWASLAALLQLAAPLIGLVLVEQLFRNLGEASRWNAKPVCLGLLCVFGFDLVLHAEALLFLKYDPDALQVRGIVHAAAVPFLFVASQRGRQWLRRMQVSRTAAFYSATLVLAGAYLLFMAAVGYYVRYFGGSWGRALQMALLAVALVLLLMMAFSSQLRSWLKVKLSKHFYRYRFDYREEWLRFTALLSTNRSPPETCELIVQGLARMVECQAGSLWTRGPDGDFTQAAAWQTERVSAVEPARGTLCTFLASNGWVIDLDEFRDTPRRYDGLALPTWLLATPKAWLVVPLLAGEELMGFVVLKRPLAETKLNWEVLDLLKTAGRQAAGHLAQMQATEALLEARKFEAFNRMSAFVVHDLKNIVAQLSLMMKNAERLHANPEFQQDMLLTVQSSLEKMKRLMLQLREGATPPGGGRGVELAPLLARLQALAAAQGRAVELDCAPRLATRGHEERLERVLGHLVQNALDATPPHGRVWLDARRHHGQIEVEVGDTGSGMSEDFIRNRLFRPFSTTKHNGMGIGTHEAQQYIRELGGTLTVHSAVGEGTVMTVSLPLFDTGQASDLMPLEKT